ncbi:hypothetical protein ACPCIR_16805 [Mycobacterium sp. NPDC051198]
MQISSHELPNGVIVQVTDPTLVPMGDAYAARQITWTEAQAGKPRRQFTFEVQDGRPVCTSIVIEADDGIPVRAKDLTDVRLDNIRDDAFAVVGLWHGEGSAKVHTWGRSSFATDRKSVEAVSKRRKLTPELLQRIAEIHRSVPTARVDAVMAAFGVSERQAKRYIAAAREKGMIE